MSDHSKVLIPIEAWCYQSPDIRRRGIKIDIGLLAEALIYYDCVYIAINNQDQFLQIVDWFKTRNAYMTFIGLLNSGVIKIYEYSFITSAILKDGVYSLMNMQDTEQAVPGSFNERYFNNERFEESLPDKDDRNNLIRGIKGNVIEVKADNFGLSVENAREDLHEMIVAEIKHQEDKLNNRSRIFRSLADKKLQSRVQEECEAYQDTISIFDKFDQ